MPRKTSPTIASAPAKPAKTKRVAPAPKRNPPKASAPRKPAVGLHAAGTKRATKSVDAATPPAAKVKLKLVRDSFTMPQAEFDLIASLKERALGFKRATKKSELLRAGLHALMGLSNASLKAALDALEPIKSGRPKKLG